MIKPLVSVCCITYNHEQYIGKTLDSFINQKTNFPFEIIVHDDCSTDGTTDIIKKYALQYPDLIKPIYQHQNQYSLGIKSIYNNFVLPKAHGTYIALCEGDDYWTDSLKLQKQADFLSNNPGHSMCCGGYIAKYSVSGEEKTVILNKIGTNEDANGFDFTLADMQKRWITKTLTSMFVKEKYNPDISKKYSYPRDIHLFYHLLAVGKGYYFKEVFGYYNVHPGGVNSMHQGKTNSNAAYNSYKELHFHNNNEFTRAMALGATLSLLNYDLYNKYSVNTFRRKMQLLKEATLLIRNTRECKMLFSSFINKNLKNKIKSTSPK